jgi:hypothetical protein
MAIGSRSSWTNFSANSDWKNANIVGQALEFTYTKWFAMKIYITIDPWSSTRMDWSWSREPPGAVAKKTYFGKYSQVRLCTLCIDVILAVLEVLLYIHFYVQRLQKSVQKINP